MPKVSIIVPVYNAQNGLIRCIESVINQEFEDFELILMDDGSKDSSGAICDKYASEDDRIRVVHKSNSGVSDTRNQALDIAKGEYIQFIDSDDWITKDATKLLYRTAVEHNCDMVISDFYRVVGERVSHKGSIDDDVVMTRDEFSEYMMESPADFYYGVLWNKLFKREIIEKYHLRMDADISWCEDFMFNLEYIRHTKSICALRIPIYYYVKTKGSLVSQGMSISKTINMKKMVFKYYHKFYKDIMTEEEYEKNRLQVYKFLIDSASDGVVMPNSMLGGIKLGNERSSAIETERDGMLIDGYRERKLLDRCLEPAALQNDLSLNDVKLLMYLLQLDEISSKKEIKDFTNMSSTALSLSLQRLASKGYIKCFSCDIPKESQKEADKDINNEAKKENKKETKKETKLSPLSQQMYFGMDERIKIEILPAASVLIEAISKAQNDFEAVKYKDFSEDELVQYAYLMDKIKKNVRKGL